MTKQTKNEENILKTTPHLFEKDNAKTKNSKKTDRDHKFLCKNEKTNESEKNEKNK